MKTFTLYPCLFVLFLVLTKQPLQAQKYKLQLEKLNTEINSNQYDEISPVISVDGTTMYFTRVAYPDFEKNLIKLPRGDHHSREVTDLVASELASIAFTDKGLKGVGEHDDCAMATWISKCARSHVADGFGITTL